MSDGYFDRLEAELSGLTRQGAHLDAPARRATARAALIAARTRRVGTALLLALLLAISLASEFPATAHGRVTAAAAVGS